jgi:hypothetical protein
MSQGEVGSTAGQEGLGMERLGMDRHGTAGTERGKRDDELPEDPANREMPEPVRNPEDRPGGQIYPTFVEPPPKERDEH